jgi:DNA/RNA endonuclease YhcR with UshA esterase domain
MPEHLRRSRVAVLSALLALLALVAVPLTSAVAKRDGHGHGQGHHQPTIAQARAMPLGTVVTIEGTVTTPSGVFASSFFDEGFAVQDETAGIFVSFPNTDIGVRPPRHVEVTGVLQDSSGLLVIAPASVRDVKVKGRDKPVQATWVRTGSVGESTEGSLVRAVGVITQGPIVDGDFGHKFFIDDGSGEITVFVNLGTNVDVQGLAVGQLIEVTGFSSQFTDHYEIDIRGPQDLAQPVK